MWGIFARFTNTVEEGNNSHYSDTMVRILHCSVFGNTTERLLLTGMPKEKTAKKMSLVDFRLTTVKTVYRTSQSKNYSKVIERQSCFFIIILLERQTH